MTNSYSATIFVAIETFQMEFERSIQNLKWLANNFMVVLSARINLMIYEYGCKFSRPFYCSEITHFPNFGPYIDLFF